MRTALRQGFSGRRPPFFVEAAPAPPWPGLARDWSLLALGARRAPLGRRLSDPGRRVPASSRIVLRAGTLYLR